MILYDITSGDKLPHFLVNDTRGRVIRCLYDQNGVISLLTGIHRSDGVHLNIFSSQGYTTANVPNPAYHFDVLTQSPAKYARFFNTKKFVIEYTKSKFAEPIQRRLPDWTFVGFTDLGYPRLELEILE